jgi:hypothetical protein
MKHTECSFFRIRSKVVVVQNSGGFHKRRKWLTEQRPRAMYLRSVFRSYPGTLSTLCLSTHQNFGTSFEGSKQPTMKPNNGEIISMTMPFRPILILFSEALPFL